MANENLIAVDVFCAHHRIETTFIDSLEELGLVEITIVDERAFIEADQITQLEKYVRLHYDLDINFEGLEAITHLLARMHNMQDEITTLRNRLRLYEDDDPA